MLLWLFTIRLCYHLGMTSPVAVTPDMVTDERYTTGSIGKLLGKNYRTIAIYRNKGLLHMEQDPISGH